MFELTKEIQTYKYKIALILLSPPIPKKKNCLQCLFFFFFWEKKLSPMLIGWPLLTQVTHETIRGG